MFFLAFLVTAILTGVRKYLIVVLHFPYDWWCWASSCTHCQSVYLLPVFNWIFQAFKYFCYDKELTTYVFFLAVLQFHVLNSSLVQCWVNFCVWYTTVKWSGVVWKYLSLIQDQWMLFVSAWSMCVAWHLAKPIVISALHREWTGFHSPTKRLPIYKSPSTIYWEGLTGRGGTHTHYWSLSCSFSLI